MMMPRVGLVATRRLVDPTSFALADDCPRRGAKLIPDLCHLRIVLAISDDPGREAEEAPADAG